MNETCALGLDILGLDVSDFVPYLGLVGKMMGGVANSKASAAGGTGAVDANTQKAIDAAIAKERQKEAEQRAEESAARMKMILVGVLAVGGAAGLALAFRRKS